MEELLPLLADIRAGKEAAFVRLTELYDALLRDRAAAFSRNPHEAEDAYQEACLALYRAALRYREGEGVTFGLFAKICMNNALSSIYRKVNSRKTAEGAAVDLIPFDEDRFLAEFSDPMVEEENAEQLLSQVRNELSPYERKVFGLYIIEGMTSGEIAKQLGRDEKSVKNAIGRLLCKLRKRLGK